MKLHQIKFIHASPKDREEGTKAFVVFDGDEAALRDRIDADFNYGGWKDSAADTRNIYDNDDVLIGRETHADRMLRLRGEMFDEDADYADAYYGITHWGWTEGVEITDEDAAVLLRLGVAVDWRPATRTTDDATEEQK